MSPIGDIIYSDIGKEFWRKDGKKKVNILLPGTNFLLTNQPE